MHKSIIPYPCSSNTMDGWMGTLHKHANQNQESASHSTPLLCPQSLSALPTSQLYRLVQLLFSLYSHPAWHDTLKEVREGECELYSFNT